MNFPHLSLCFFLTASSFPHFSYSYFHLILILSSFIRLTTPPLILTQTLLTLTLSLTPLPQAELVPEESSRVPSVAQASSWLSLLLDTKYQHLVMTSQVDIHRLLLSCFTQVNNLVSRIQGFFLYLFLAFLLHFGISLLLF